MESGASTPSTFRPEDITCCVAAMSASRAAVVTPSFAWINRKCGESLPRVHWAWSMEAPDGQLWEAIMKIEKTEGKLAGSFGREDSDWTIPMRNIKVKGALMTFETVFERDGQSMIIKNRAIVTAKTIKGKSLRDGADSPEPREWKATRK